VVVAERINSGNRIAEIVDDTSEEKIRIDPEKGAQSILARCLIMFHRTQSIFHDAHRRP
jgi:hypothetical protein